MVTIILIALIFGCIVYIYLQGKSVGSLKKAYDEEVETKELLTKHIKFMEDENATYAKKLQEAENHINSLKFNDEWKLRDSPETAIDRVTNSSRDKKPKG